MAERAPLGVLAGKADRNALGQQSGEGQRLRVSPVDAGVQATATPGQLAVQLLEELEIFRPGVDPLVEAYEPFGRDVGVRLGAVILGELRPQGGRPPRADRVLGPACLQRLGRRAAILDRRFRVTRRQHSLPCGFQLRRDAVGHPGRGLVR